MTTENFGIWPVYRIFYFESMRFITTSAVNSIAELNKQLEFWENQNKVRQADILNPVQNIVIQGAALSRYFWPTKSEINIHKNRAEFLRTKFQMSDDSPLRSRNLRNMIEHFDEKLDKYLEKDIAGQIIPEFIGSLSGSREVPVHAFRAFDPMTTTFEILGQKFQVAPLVGEIVRVHENL